MVKEIFGLPYYPRSLSELYNWWLVGKGPWSKRLILFVFAGFAWALWTCRNNMAIEKRFPKVPTDVICMALSFLQKWSCLLKEEGRTLVDHMRGDILRWLKDFKPNPFLVSDVVEF